MLIIFFAYAPQQRRTTFFHYFQFNQRMLFEEVNKDVGKKKRSYCRNHTQRHLSTFNFGHVDDLRSRIVDLQQNGFNLCQERGARNGELPLYPLPFASKELRVQLIFEFHDLVRERRLEDGYRS